MASRKDLKDIMKYAEKHGWVIVLTKKCHYKWTSPSGDFFYSSGSPSDWRGLERLKQDLRRRGCDVRITDQH